MKTILLVEDEPNLAFNLKLNLEAEGYKIIHYDRGDLLLKDLSGGELKFDLVLLDVMLPIVDGFELAKEMRAQNKLIPILMLTARNAREDRLRGLGLGVDDYITKPFSLEELYLKIARSLERIETHSILPDLLGTSEGRDEIVDLKGLKLDLREMILSYAEQSVSLTDLECRLLACFFHSIMPGSDDPNVNTNLVELKSKIWTREELLAKVWGITAPQETRTIDVFIARLRKHLETVMRDQNLGSEKIASIESVRGRGYRLTL